MSNIWTEWAQQKETQYLDAERKPYPPPVRHMIAFYGKGDGVCEKCIHLKAVEIQRAYEKTPAKYAYRCVRFNPTKGRWKLDYSACGLREEVKDEKPTN